MSQVPSLVSFLKRQKPACTIFPFYDKLGSKPSLLNKLINRSFEDFNENIFASHCSKREWCVVGPCIGRPIPMYPELEKLHPALTKLPIGTYKGVSVYMYTATLCDSCPVKTSCGKPCGTMTSYLEKDVDMEDALAVVGDFNARGQFQESFNGEELEEGVLSRRLTVDDFIKPVPYTRQDIPWHVLTANQESIVKLRVFQGMTFKEIANKKKTNPNRGAIANVERDFKRALSKLRKAGTILKEKRLDK